MKKKPLAFQFINGKKIFVPCEYELNDKVLSFCFPRGYDPCYELVIDPLLIFSTYSGSTADNWGSTATPGEHGNLYSSGVTNQASGGQYPTTPGVFQTTYGGLYDIGILKYDSTGSQLLYATFLGGNDSESPHSLVMDSNGDLMVLGTTSSLDFPTTDQAYDRSFNGGIPVSHVVDYFNGSDIFISRISKDGINLVASTFLGGASNDGLNPGNGPLTKNYGDQLRGDIITDADGNIVISSVTQSKDFPVQNSFGMTFRGGGTDAVIVKMNPDLSGVLWSTYLGGSGVDASHTLKLDKQKNIYVAGGTTSNDFPVTTGSYQNILHGNADGWIAKLAADGSSILNATYTGTTAYDQVYFLDLNVDEEIYVYGQTSGDFPVTPGVYSNPGSGQFIQKFDNSLSALAFSTVFGSGRGIPDISPTAFLVNECNNLYMAGWGGIVNSATGFWNSDTRGMATTADAFQKTSAGSDFYFIVLTDDAAELLYATYLGGEQSRTHVDGGTSRFDKDGIVYHSVCSGCAAFNATSPPHATSDFPTTAGAWSNTNGSINCNNAAFKFDLSSLKARIQTNSEKFDQPGLKVVCLPDNIMFQNFSTGGEVFEWDFGDGTKLTTSDTSAILHEYAAPARYTVKLKAIDQGTCKVVDSTATVVTINTSQAEVQGDDQVCFGNAYQLRASGGAAYEWTDDQAKVISQEAKPVVHPADTTLYFVKITESNGCVINDSVQLNVIPPIIPEFEFQREASCSERPSVRFINLTDSLDKDDIMYFDFGDGQSTNRTDEDHFFEKDGLYHVTLTGERHSCVFEKQMDIPVFRIKLPNVITPGGSAGKNDTFSVQYGDVTGVTPSDYGLKVSLTVYNRWGTVLYKNDDYKYDWSGDGLAAGIYFYEVFIQDHATCKSWLQIVK